MRKQIQLSIDNPCQENWDNMTQADNGRFCGSCQKQVMDFTGMSDSQIAVFFKKATRSVCGRFYHDQLDRNIEIPQKRIPWLKYFFQIVIPAFLVSMKATAQGKIKASVLNKSSVSNCTLVSGEIITAERRTLLGDTIIPDRNIPEMLANSASCCPIEQNGVMDFKQLIKPKPEPLLLKDAGKIKGRVIDDQGYPLPYSTIVIKGTKISTLADNKGGFTITPENKWQSVVLAISCIGFQPTELRVMNDQPLVNVVLQVGLQPMVMGQMICTKPSKKKRSNPIPLLTQKLMDTAFKFFKVFPNPVSPGASLHIEWKKSEEGYYRLELLDLSGKILHSREIWIDAEARVLNFDVPSVTAGNYLLRATNKQSGTNFTEKVIIRQQL